MSVQHYLVTVTFNETVNGAIWDVQPQTLVIDAAEAAVYFTLSAFSAPGAELSFNWNSGDGPTPITNDVPPPGPFQTLVAFENAATERTTLAYTLWDDVGVTRFSHDPEIVLEPPHP